MGHVEDLRFRGWTITSDEELGCGGLHETVRRLFFNERVLPPDPDTGGPVKTRYRNKDLLHYRRGAMLRVADTIHPRYARIRVPEPPGWRAIPRFRWLDAGVHAARLACELLRMVPPEDEHPEGTFGLHGFRSFDDVVAGPHEDGFEFGGTYVIARDGGGGVSYLHDMDGRVVLEHQLQPGEILLFHERRPGQGPVFLHGATPLEAGGQRDALVIQFDAPEDLDAAAAERADMGGIW
jgi:hypothetical protein